MPEGPEIRRAADRLHEQLAGRRLESVWFAFPELAAEADSLVGREVTAVDSWGKALLTRFDDGRVLYSHNQLYGVWKLHDAEREPDTERSLRVRLTAEGCSASLYSASDVSLWPAERLAEHPFLSRLGPDLLTPRGHAGAGRGAFERAALRAPSAGRAAARSGTFRRHRQLPALRDSFLRRAVAHGPGRRPERRATARAGAYHPRRDPTGLRTGRRDQPRRVGGRCQAARREPTAQSLCRVRARRQAVSRLRHADRATDGRLASALSLPELPARLTDL